MGMSGSSSTSTTRSNSTVTPNPPSWISGPYQDYAGKVGALNDTDAGAYTTPASANQNLAFMRASQGTPGIGADLTGYQTGLLRETDLSPYYNPWEGSVVSNALSDIDLSRRRALSTGGANATVAGAFGGARHGVADALTNEAALREAGSTAGQLRSQGFLNAQQAALSDITNTNDAARLRLSAQAADAENTRADTSLLASTGQTQREIANSNNPLIARLNLLQAQGGLLGQIPIQSFTPVNTQGTSTSTQKDNPGLLGGLSAALKVGSLFL